MGQYRHNRVRDAMISALRTSEKLEVEREPNIPGAAHRNDIRITGNASSRIARESYDISITALGAKRYYQLRNASIDDSHSPEDLVKGVFKQVADEKRRRLPITQNPIPLFPLILSTGGYIDNEYNAVMDRRKSVMGLGAFGRMER